MLLGGDEFGRTQHGNNNAWCQDNELSWFDWHSTDASLQEFVRRLVQLRQSEPVFRRTDFVVGEQVARSGLPDVIWLRPDGRPVREEDRQRDDAHALGVYLNGHEIPNHDRDGNPIKGASFLMFFNAHHEPATFTIAPELGQRWRVELATIPDAEARRPRKRLRVGSRSIVVLRRRRCS
jgi:isoamylase